MYHPWDTPGLYPADVNEVAESLGHAPLTEVNGVSDRRLCPFRRPRALSGLNVRCPRPLCVRLITLLITQRMTWFLTHTRPSLQKLPDQNVLTRHHGLSLALEEAHNACHVANAR